jgi:2-keto-3-deoxy-L-rhamnonate aldolase RhmA
VFSAHVDELHQVVFACSECFVGQPRRSRRARPSRGEREKGNRYQGGKRGFSNSPRAGRYGGLSLHEHVELADAMTTVVAQIEDPEALEQIDAIASIDGIDALFIGRGDLAVAMGAVSPDAPEIRAAAERISAAARRAGKPVMVFVGSNNDALAMREIGASICLVQSDKRISRKGK